MPAPALDLSSYFREHVFVHTHIEKTGGTSFVKGLLPILGADHVYDLRETAPRPHQMTLEERDAIWLLSGHFWFDTQERPISRQKRYFMCLRDPVERFISYYNYVVEHKLHAAHERFGMLDIEGAYQFLSRNRPNAVFNSVSIMFGERAPNTPPGQPGRVAQKSVFGLTRRKPISYERALAIMEKNYALVIPMKRVDTAVRRIGSVFGVDVHSVPRENVGVKSVTTVSERIRQELQERNAVDYKLIKHFESVFDQHLDDLPARLAR